MILNIQKILILENVKKLHTIHNGETFNIIKNELEKRDFILVTKLLIQNIIIHLNQEIVFILFVVKKNKYIFKEIKNPIIPVLSIIDYEKNIN